MAIIDTLRQIEDRLDQLTQPQAGPPDVDTIEFLKGEHTRLSARVAAARQTASTPAAAAGASGRGGSTGGMEPLRKAGDVAAMTLTAPAKGVAGLVDLGVLGGEFVDKKLGALDPNFEAPRLTPRINALADELAGRTVPESVGRSAFEGALIGPLMAGKTAAAIPAAAAGAGGGAAAKAAADAGAPWYTQILASLLGGYGAGKVADAARNVAQGVPAVGATSRIRHASRGLTSEELATGRDAATAASREGIRLLPSQAIQEAAPGWVQLQGELLSSRIPSAEAFLGETAAIAPRARALVEGLQNVGGQRPRPADLLAGDLGEAATGMRRAEFEAVNTATKPLYNAPAAVTPQAMPQLSLMARAAFSKAVKDNWADGATREALQAAAKETATVLQKKALSPADLINLVRTIESDLPAYKDMTSAASNRARQIVSETIRPLRDYAESLAPTLAQARSMQADLRGDLSNQFSEVVKQARAAGSPDTAINAAARRPELVRQLREADPMLTQELLQHTVNKAVQGGLATDTSTNLPSATGPIKVKAQLTASPEGQVLQQNLDALFRTAPDPKAAAAAFNRVLDVAANASKDTGRFAVPHPDIGAATARGVAGSKAQQVVEAGKQATGVVRRFSDAQIIRLLSKPDFMDRVLKITQMSPTKLTTAVVTSSFPELFSEEK